MSYPPVGPPGGFTGQYSGLGAYDNPPPPKSRRTLMIVLIVVAVLVVLGGGTAAVLILSTTSRTAGSAPPNVTSTSATTSTSAPAPAEPVTTITNPFADVSYQVPASWQVRPSAQTAEMNGGFSVAGYAAAFPFQCQGNSLLRAEVMSGTQPAGDPTAAATQLSAKLGDGSYTVNGTPPTHGNSSVRPITRNGASGAITTLQVTPVGNNPCYATSGTISALVLSKPNNGGLVFVLVNQAVGGPYAAQGPTDAEIANILGSVQLTG